MLLTLPRFTLTLSTQIFVKIGLFVPKRPFYAAQNGPAEKLLERLRNDARAWRKNTVDYVEEEGIEQVVVVLEDLENHIVHQHLDLIQLHL